MPVKIRLQRHGKKAHAYYHIVIADGRAPRDGKFIEKIRIDTEIHESQIKLDELKKEISEMRDIKNKLNQIERYIDSAIYSSQ